MKKSRKNKINRDFFPSLKIPVKQTTGMGGEIKK